MCEISRGRLRKTVPKEVWISQATHLVLHPKHIKYIFNCPESKATDLPTAIIYHTCVALSAKLFGVFIGYNIRVESHCYCFQCDVLLFPSVISKNISWVIWFEPIVCNNDSNCWIINYRMAIACDSQYLNRANVICNYNWTEIIQMKWKMILICNL